MKNQNQKQSSSRLIIDYSSDTIKARIETDPRRLRQNIQRNLIPLIMTISTFISGILVLESNFDKPEKVTPSNSTSINHEIN